MGCFNTAPLKYRDALCLMRNLDPSRQNIAYFCYLMTFFSTLWLSYYWNVLNYHVTILDVLVLMCILKSRGHNIAVAVSSRHWRKKKKKLCVFLIEMGLKCVTFLPDECTDSAEMLTYIMTELSAHSLHPSWHIYTSASAPDQTSHTSKNSIFFHFGNLYKRL